MLRNWHERPKTNRLWKKLRLIIVISTSEYIKLLDDQSPFNVGFKVKLTEFSPDQIHFFAQSYDLETNAIRLPQWIDLVGGHPYLLSLIFSHLSMTTEVNITEFFDVASTNQGIFNSYLRQILNRLDSSLRSALKSVVSSTNAVTLEDSTGHKLQSMGLIRWEGNQALPACQLYRKYFSNHL
jgi:serine/threonine-protein kinase